MVEHSRMELRQRGAAGMLRAAARVCVASWIVLLGITFIGAAYEGAVERYSSSLSVANGKTSVRFSFNPAEDLEETRPLWSKLFPFSVTVDEPLQGQDPDAFQEANEQVTEAAAADEATQVAQDDKQDAPVKEHEDNKLSRRRLVLKHEDRRRLPTLVLKRVFGNESNQTLALGSEELVPSSSFRQRRRIENKNLVQPLDSAGMLLGVLLLLTLILVGMLYLIACHHAALLGLIAHSVATSYMGKTVRMRDAIKSCFRSRMVLLVRLSILQGALRGIAGLMVLDLFLKSSKNSETLLRLATTPFVILAPFRDKEIIESGMAANVAGYILADYLLEGLAHMVYILASWVTIIEGEQQNIRAIQRSWNLLLSNPLQALSFKVAECVLCGRSFRWLLGQVIGTHVSLLVVAAAETYFTVLWLVFYMSARSKQAHPPFSHQNLEDFLDRDR